MFAPIPIRFPLFLAGSSRHVLPLIPCPALKQSPAIPPRRCNILARSTKRLGLSRNISTNTPASARYHDNKAICRYELPAVNKYKAIFIQQLPQACPGCGALARGLASQDEAGFYNLSRKSVKTFVSHHSHLSSCTWPGSAGRFEGIPPEGSDLSLRPPLFEDVLDATTVAQSGRQEDEEIIGRDVSLPICNRCHRLLHHNGGQAIIHPSLQSIQRMIDESPYSYNHIYHILDAADFPLSLIPQLQRRLDLMPQRSQNRRAKTAAFSHGRRAEMSFIITRSDLLAPQKEQVDALMPYLQQVLRDALGSSGRDVRLGNIRCVSAKRGWWTKQVKDEIWERGAGGWMVGKVNVGKSNLFECVFPKGGQERTIGQNDSTSNRPAHVTIGISRSQVAAERSQNRPSLEPDATIEDSLLPPVQPELKFPVMPIVSHLPGTTASPIRIPFGNGKGELIDLPGLARGSLEDHVLESYRANLVMRQRVRPKQFVIKPSQSLLISGLIRITPSTPEVTVLAYPFVPLSAHVTSTDKAIGMHTQTRPTQVPTIARPEIGPKMGLAGLFRLQWDVTKQRAGPLTSSSAAARSTQTLPFAVFSTDILVEGCGWIELVAQVRKKDIESTIAGQGHPVVEVWSPNGDYIAARRPMNAWLLGKPKAAAGRRQRRSMKGVKKSWKIALRHQSP